MASDATSKYKDLFCSEAEDQLGILSRTLLLLEQDVKNLELYATLMRSAHTIKGAAATMGYTEMARLAHALEDVFHAGERGAIVLDPAAVSTAFSALDRMTLSLASIRDENKELPITDIALALEKLVGHIESGAATPAAPISAPSLSTVPATPPSPPVPTQVFAAPTSIKVGIERLDALMGLFEEMLMLRLKLDTMLEPALEITKGISDPLIKQKLFFIKEFTPMFHELARLLSETQEELLRIRLVPLEQIFGQFPRMVRDLSLREGKRVNFRVTGGSVELDRTVLDGLGGALAHLLRNAVDHGIVSEGTIVLSATHENERAHVIVEDDGAGIDYDRVRQVAIERGVVGADEANAMHKGEIAELLFHPNMSTNTQVTDISGRGVGLSAVRGFVQDVGGRISVMSPVSLKGGTRFLLDLPISLATVKVLLVKSSGFTFAIPFSSIVRTLSLSRDRVVQSANQDAIVVDEKLVPFLWLHRLLGLMFSGVPKEAGLAEELHVVLLSVNRQMIALAVDVCVGEHELLVKSLPPVLRGIKGFSGSALLPDGRTILLLDVEGLLLRAFGDILESTHADIPHTQADS